ncbi:MAG: citrate/2-methylcitrate synthase [Oscillospiraceae bacterium]|nr:citrate/2-methylcitrate synthase [Oscillospiraceae bacterium]
MARYDYASAATPLIEELAGICCDEFPIDPELYTKFDVKRGLRDLNGKGVLAGLTNIGNVCASKEVDGKSVPCDGKLYYRGVDVEELVAGFIRDDRMGFEETAYLLLFGRLPDRTQLADFQKLLADLRYLPSVFTRDVIMKAPSDNMMNTLAKCVLTLYSYDSRANDVSIPNVLRQCLSLISLFPLICVYGYQAYHFKAGQDLFIHQPNPSLSLAENILYMLRKDSQFTPLEAKLLDMALVLHAEHGGGNNSTFTVHVVSSSGTDTYSAIAAALGSLKGPKHGGANIKVCQMFDDLQAHVKDWEDEDALRDYLRSLLHKEGFDHSGLIYGMGHAVYSISDPRARVFKGFVEKLSVEKGREKEFELYARVERLASEVIASERRIYKGVCANVDFYSGFVYRMLGLPEELFTPIFAVARIAGWSAHRIEELINSNKIIRPAYKAIVDQVAYVPMEER